MSKQIALFDIDYTLFDTDTFIARYKSLLASHLAPMNEKDIAEAAQKAYDKTRSILGYFDSVYYSKEIVTLLNAPIEPSELEKKVFTGQLMKDSLYQETIPVMRKLHELGIVSGIFSTGDAGFQRKKIKPLEKYFPKEHMHIFALKDTEIGRVLKLYIDNQIFLIDDYLPVLYAAKKADSAVTTVWVKRGRFADLQHTDSKLIDFTVNNLEEVLPIVVNT